MYLLFVYNTWFFLIDWYIDFFLYSILILFFSIIFLFDFIFFKQLSVETITIKYTYYSFFLFWFIAFLYIIYIYTLFIFLLIGYFKTPYVFFYTIDFFIVNSVLIIDEISMLFILLLSFIIPICLILNIFYPYQLNVLNLYISSLYFFSCFNYFFFNKVNFRFFKNNIFYIYSYYCDLWLLFYSNLLK